MKLRNPRAEVFVPDRVPLEEALPRTTHLGIGAHPDDLEFMTWHGILECLNREDRWFSGVTVTDGRGSSRTDEYGHYSDDEMVRVRLREQQTAAVVGGYASLSCLMYSSADVRGEARDPVVADLETLLRATRPRAIYTHNPCDRHDSHVAVFTAVLQALRNLGPEYHPEEFHGCEVWRSLDWMLESDRVVFDVSAHENMTMALMGVYDSQIAGGKRYDLATAGRRRANATYHDAYTPDRATLMEYAMDLRPLLEDPTLAPAVYALQLVDRMREDVRRRLEEYSG